MGKSFWTNVTGKSLAQGDLLTGCLVPQFGADFGAAGEGAIETLALGEQTLIIVTQSCDLENSKVELVAMCPAHTLEEFEVVNQKFRGKERWEAVRKGRVEGLHRKRSANHPCAIGEGVLRRSYAATSSGAVTGAERAASVAGRQWCGSNCARSRCLSAGSRSKTSLR